MGLVDKLDTDFQRFDENVGEYINKHPITFVARICLEPSYALRTVLKIPTSFPSDYIPKNFRGISIFNAVFFEVSRLTFYGYIVYQACQTLK